MWNNKKQEDEQANKNERSSSLYQRHLLAFCERAHSLSNGTRFLSKYFSVYSFLNTKDKTSQCCVLKSSDL